MARAWGEKKAPLCFCFLLVSLFRDVPGCSPFSSSSCWAFTLCSHLALTTRSRSPSCVSRFIIISGRQDTLLGIPKFTIFSQFVSLPLLIPYICCPLNFKDNATWPAPPSVSPEVVLMWLQRYTAVKRDRSSECAQLCRLLFLSQSIPDVSPPSRQLQCIQLSLDISISHISPVRVRYSQWCNGLLGSAPGDFLLKGLFLSYCPRGFSFGFSEDSWDRKLLLMLCIGCFTQNSSEIDFSHQCDHCLYWSGSSRRMREKKTEEGTHCRLSGFFMYCLYYQKIYVYIHICVYMFFSLLFFFFFNPTLPFFWQNAKIHNFFLLIFLHLSLQRLHHCTKIIFILSICCMFRLS